MKTAPRAIEKFEQEKSSSFEGASFFLDHPVDRLKYHITSTGGKIVKSEFSANGFAYVIWESDGKQYNAWSTWPDQTYQISWKAMP